MRLDVIFSVTLVDSFTSIRKKLCTLQSFKSRHPNSLPSLRKSISLIKK